jgi:hypothetical protein
VALGSVGGPVSNVPLVGLIVKPRIPHGFDEFQDDFDMQATRWPVRALPTALVPSSTR